VTSIDKLLVFDGRPAEILLVDDNRGDAILAAHAFKDAKTATNLTTASTGEMALEFLREAIAAKTKRLPDLILLDLQLPQMSGMDVLTEIKQDERLKHIPVIVMSNSGDGSKVLKSYHRYANAYVMKPSDLTKFREAIAMIEQFFFVLATLPVVEPTE